MDKSIGTDKSKALCCLLREIRQEAGLKQIDMADRLGTLQATVSNYETGQRRLDVLELWQVCEACGVGLDDFVGRLIVRCRV